MSRSWTSDQKRQVAARQEWRCGHCVELLNAAFEVDHVVALENGGPDDVATNSMALCSNCHALKTQKERVDRIKLARKRLDKLNKEPVPKPMRAEDLILDETNPFAKFCFLPESSQRTKSVN
jgi:5-methylcytosine-specific restriction endonuclease McrA